MGEGKRRRRHRRRQASWANLPEDMLGGVLRRLPSFVDRARFRGVCRAWRAAWLRQPHPPMPWHSVPGHCISLSDGAIYRVTLPPEAARCLGAFGDWLALVTLTEKEPPSGSIAAADGRPFLLNPFSSAKIPLPPWQDQNEPIRKIVMSSAPDSSCVISPPWSTAGENRRRISACRPGEGHEGAWWPVSLAFDLQDIIFYEGKLHALASCDQLLVFDSDELDLLRREPWRLHEEQLPPPPTTKIDYDDHKMKITSRRYLVLVECKGRLLTVIRYLRVRYLTVTFEVHALAQTDDGEDDRWMPVKGFGGRALYVGDVCSGSFPAASDDQAADGGMVEENAICYVDEELEISGRLYTRSWSDVVNRHWRRLRRFGSYGVSSRCSGVYWTSQESRVYDKWSARTGRWQCYRAQRFDEVQLRRFPQHDLIPVVI